MSEPGEGLRPNQPIILPTDATTLDPRMTLDRSNERPNLKPSMTLFNITERRVAEIRETQKKIERKFPLLGESSREIYRTAGSITILEHAMYAKDGLMALAEDIKEATDDLTDQARTSLYEGASMEMAGWVLGYENSKSIPEGSPDEDAWKERYQTEEEYFHKLFEARQEIPNKKYIKYEPETAHMTLFLEFAQTMKIEELKKYMEREVDERARYNLGIADQEIPDMELFNRWKNTEKIYLEDAITKHKASQGKKDYTFLY